MQLLSIASEAFPLIKTGGLADVVGALPRALADHGVIVRTLLPAYPAIAAQLASQKPRLLHRYKDLLGHPARLLAARLDGLDLILLEAPALFDRAGGPYGDASGLDWPDNAIRFAALARAGADIAGGRIANYRPDIVHAHDWQAALALAYLRYDGSAVPGVLTVHNLAFQGRFDADLFPKLGLPEAAFSVDGVEYYGGVGFLKAGLQAADAITTVSPTYAREILDPAFGMGLDGLLRARSDRLHGIVNGIDTAVWNPADDPHLARPFTARTLPGRRANKRAVEARFGLDQGAGPLLTVISRLTWQKGLDVLAAGLDDIVARGGRIALLGSGDAALESALLAAAARHPGRIGAIIGYDEPLSHLLQGGADAILIPSRFEPCGLTQLYGLRYGCLPVVARTGGLADTVIDANVAATAARVATGFVLTRADAASLHDALDRLFAAYADPPRWVAMQRAAMASDVSWGASAAAYARLYAGILAPRPA